MESSLIWAIIAAVVCTVAAQDPEIVDEIWTEVKPVGRTGRLNCTVANKQTHQVVWEHLDSGQIISKDLSIDLSYNPIEGGKRKYEVKVRGPEDRVTYMLIVRRLRQQDAGKYQCYVRIQATDFTDRASKIGLLVVQVAPVIRPGETTAVLVVGEGENSDLRCAATGNPFPNITWVRSDGGILPTGGAQFRGAVLPLKNTTVKMGGVYRCVADNNIKPPAQHLASVLVSNKPTVRVVQDTVGQAQNRQFDAKLECIISGYPEPAVKFEMLIKGSRITIGDDTKFEINKQTTDNQNLKANEQWYTLKIKNVQANDYTDYFCIGQNAKGSSEAMITMFETTECQGYNCPSLSSSSSLATVVKVSFVVMVIAVISHLLVVAH